MIVWLASYPRSGNTFFRVILNSVFDIKTYSIYDDRGDIGADEKTSEIVGHEFLPKDFDLEKARDEEKTYYIKTHGKPLNNEDKVIYLIRDGRESTLSNMVHQNSFYNKNYTLKDAIFGNIDMGSWGNHISEWNPKKRDKTLLINFEELIDTPLKYIKRISEFLNIEPVGGSIPTFKELQEINPMFFRSGKKASWKDTYTDEEHKLFWLKNATQMKEYGYNNDIPEQFTNNHSSELFRILSLENEYRIQKLDKSIQQKLNLLSKNNPIKADKESLRSKQEVITKQSEGLKELRILVKNQDENIRERKEALRVKQEVITKQSKCLAELEKILNTKFLFNAKQKCINVFKKYSALKEENINENK